MQEADIHTKVQSERSTPAFGKTVLCAVPSVELFCGDCIAVMKTFADKSFDITVTDPPYNVGYKYNSHDDEMENYMEWCSDWLFECERLTKGIVAISCGTVNIGMWHNIKKPTWVAAWHKPATMGRCPLGFNNWEPILIYGKPVKQSVDVIKAVIKPDESINFHPCPKPLNWAAMQLHHFANEGGAVLDPFSGSGTTMLAAYQQKFSFTGIEKDEQYYEKSINRFKQATKQQRLF